MQSKLGQIANMRAGYPFRGTIKEDSAGNISVIQARDITDLGELIEEGLVKTTLPAKRSADVLKQGDILFIAKGHRHFACYIREDMPEVTCAPSLYLIRIEQEYKKRINPEFIAWQINQRTTQNYFEKFGEGSRLISIRKEILANTPIAIPAIEMQNTIAKLYVASIKEHALLVKMKENRKQQHAAIAYNLMREHV